MGFGCEDVRLCSNATCEATSHSAGDRSGGQEPAPIRGVAGTASGLEAVANQKAVQVEYEISEGSMEQPQSGTNTQG